MYAHDRCPMCTKKYRNRSVSTSCVISSRRGHEILFQTLPPKFEHVLYLRPSEVQGALYEYNMGQLTQGGSTMSSGGVAGPLKAFAVCSKVFHCSDCVVVVVHVCHYILLPWLIVATYASKVGYANFELTKVTNFVVYRFGIILTFTMRRQWLRMPREPPL